ncbi:MAG: carbohydrate porin [Planctomycetota bacterium]|nr:carbohydrate porin [Planctomycetota bacterium]MEC9232559.1 carbohydrate porin [Planctomycetota bacterium]
MLNPTVLFLMLLCQSPGPGDQAPGGTATVGPASGPSGPPEGQALRTEESPDGSVVMTEPNQYLNITSVAPVEPGARFFYGDWPWGSDGLTGDWGGARSRLVDEGIFVIGEYTSMLQQNLSGGAEEAFYGAGVVELELTLDAETIAGLEGGLLFTNFTYSGWYNEEFTGFGSFSPVGSSFGVNNNFPQQDARDQGQLDQLYWRQTLCDGRFRISVGKIDANVTFMNLGAAGGFMYGTAAIPATATQFLPTFPNAATGLQMQLDLTDRLTGSFGWWDGSTSAFDPATGQTGPRTGDRGTQSFFDNQGNWFLVNQWSLDWMDRTATPGRASVGAWLQTGTTATQGDSTTGVSDVPGVYLQGQQVLWSPDTSIAGEGGGIVLFGRADWSPDDRNAVTLGLTAGISATGVVPGRVADALGIMGSWSKFSDEPSIFQSTLPDGRPGASGGSESAIEGFYRIQLTPSVMIQPGIEWIIDPGGGSPPSLGDAVVPYLVINLQF